MINCDVVRQVDAAIVDTLEDRNVREHVTDLTDERNPQPSGDHVGALPNPIGNGSFVSPISRISVGAKRAQLFAFNCAG